MIKIHESFTIYISGIYISGVIEIEVLEILSCLFAKFANNHTDFGLLKCTTTANAKAQYTVLISAV